MNKSASALVSLAVVAGIAGGTSITAQAHPASAAEHTAAHHASTVAQTRLQTLLHAPSSVDSRGFRPNDGGGLQH
ncbi:MAG TPA: hypothetical protein VN837_08150 [Chloroflexota bacterium]|nr:hypothetical protein [Chloroflexota bacterium]